MSGYLSRLRRLENLARLAIGGQPVPPVDQDVAACAISAALNTRLLRIAEGTSGGGIEAEEAAAVEAAEDVQRAKATHGIESREYRQVIAKYARDEALTERARAKVAGELG